MLLRYPVIIGPCCEVVALAVEGGLGWHHCIICHPIQERQAFGGLRRGESPTSTVGWQQGDREVCTPVSPSGSDAGSLASCLVRGPTQQQTAKGAVTTTQDRAPGSIHPYLERRSEPGLCPTRSEGKWIMSYSVPI